MLPLSLLKSTEGHSVLCELKSGETYNGKLVKCDQYMNMVLKTVICTSRDGSRFWKMVKVYLKGNTIKYISVPEQIIDLVKEEPENLFDSSGRGRGRGRGGRGRGRGGYDSSGRGRGSARGTERGGRGGGRGRGRGSS